MDPNEANAHDPNDLTRQEGGDGLEILTASAGPPLETHSNNFNVFTIIQPTVVLVDGVVLTTYLVDGSHYSRPLYASPALTTDQLMGHCRDSDLLHVFSNTRVGFEVLLRTIGPVEGPVKVFLHLAAVLDNWIADLVVLNTEDISPFSLNPNRGLIIELPVFPVDTGLSGTRRRLQVFDQERRLIFTKEWDIEVGILNEDAESWLKESQPTFLAEEASLIEAKHSIEATPPIPIPIHHIEPRFHSRTASASISFVSLDERISSPMSRTDSVATIHSPLSITEGANGMPQTVDLFQQLGFWIYGTRVGQMISNYDPSENVKTIYSLSPLWLMGKQYQNDCGVGNEQVTRVIKVDSLVSIMRQSIPRWRSHLVPDTTDQQPLSEKGFQLTEILRISCQIPHPFISQVIPFITINDGLVLESHSDDVLIIEACGAKYHLQYKVDNNNGSHLVVIKAQAGLPSSPSLVRGFLVDLVSKMLSNTTLETVEFLGLKAQQCHIEIGPHPNALVSAVGSCNQSINIPEIFSLQVLLWSEHVHDWISRILIVKKDAFIIEISSPFKGIEPLRLDMSLSQVFFFADATWRFAFSTKGAWFCFRCNKEDDFRHLTHFLPLFLPKPEPLIIPSSSGVSGSDGVTLPQSLKSQINLKGAESLPPGLATFFLDFESLFWFTYRKDFPRLVPSILSSDAGFGCMIRAGQSMMAEALARLGLGSQRHLQQISTDPSLRAEYDKIIGLFQDSPSIKAPFSIHNLAQVGAQLGTPIGEYFNPTTIARAFRRQCRHLVDYPLNIMLIKEGIFRTDELLRMVNAKPLTVLIPLRLGIDFLNYRYAPLLRYSLSCPLTLGILGGRSSRAFYIVGFQDDSLLYLDPHALRPTVTELERALDQREYHTKTVCEMAITALDPTILLSFLCKTETDVQLLRKMLASVILPMPLFSFP